jgi:hypothetical protein
MYNVPVHMLRAASSNDEIVDWLEANGVLFMARHCGVEMFAKARLSRQTLLHMVTKARREQAAGFDLSRSSIATSDQWWRDAFQALHKSQPWRVKAGKITKTFIVLAFDWAAALEKLISPGSAKNGMLFFGIIASVFIIGIPFVVVGCAMRKTIETEPLTETIDEASLISPPQGIQQTRFYF